MTKTYSIVAVLALAASAACSDDAPMMETPDAAPEPPPDSDILYDDLSMPEEPTLELDQFVGSERCGDCHEQHYSEWRQSLHAYAMVDPVYKALVKVRQEDFDGKQDRFCLQCHTPIGTRGGDIQPGFDFDSLQPLSLEGVNCETCHVITGVERPFNAGMQMSPEGPIQGPIENPIPNNQHESEFSTLFDSAILCASCHDVIEVDGLNLERPYEEWLESPAAVAGQTCQSCHMPVQVGKASKDSDEGEIHQHYFLGVDLPLSDGFLESEEELNEMRTRIATLLSSSATISLEAEAVEPGEQIDLIVNLTNNIQAHNLPTGSSFNRQIWLEVIATDDNGAVIYETGTLDGNGDLKNYFSDEDPFGDSDLIELGSRFTDIFGVPEIFSWRATEHHTNSLSPHYDRTYTLFVPTDESTAGPVHIEARLRFRAFAPFLLRALELDALTSKLEIFDIDSIAIDVEVSSP